MKRWFGLGEHFSIVASNMGMCIYRGKIHSIHPQVLASQQKKKNRYFHLVGSLKKIGKYVGRGNRRSIAAAVVQNVGCGVHVQGDVGGDKNYLLRYQ